MLSDNMKNRGFSIASSGNLALRGQDLTELSDLTNRPLYILDEIKIKENIAAYKKALSNYYPGKSYIYYASKALQNLAICGLMQEEDVGLDLCSYGEMIVASHANFSLSKAIVHGNNKSFEELEYAIQNGIGHIIIDNEDEYQMILEVCDKLQVKVSILLRVNPHIEVNTHSYIATGVKDAKFGMGFDEGFIALVKKISKSENVKFDGLHSHIGSQIADPLNMVEAVSILVDYISELQKHNIACPVLNIGGGVGIKYKEDDQIMPIYDFMKEVLSKLASCLAEKVLDLPFLMIEPGRSIIGDAGYTLYKVGTIKKSNMGYSYAAVNGGMSDNIRTPLYDASYDAKLVNDVDRDSSEESYKIVGKCCESGDVLIQNISMPKLSFNDSIIIFSTGAYNASMASNFNKHNFPGMIMVGAGAYRWIVKEQPIDDLIMYDLPLLPRA